MQSQMQISAAVSAATGSVVNQGVSSAGQVQSQVQPQQPQQPIRVYFQPQSQDPAAIAAAAAAQQQQPNTNPVFVHPSGNFMVTFLSFFPPPQYYTE